MRRILLSKVKHLNISPCGVLRLLSCLRKTHNSHNFSSTTCSKIELLLPRESQDRNTITPFDAKVLTTELRDHFSVVAQLLYWLSALGPKTKVGRKIQLEHLFRINTVCTEFRKLLYYFGTIFGISHTEPFRSCVEHFASSNTLTDEVIDHKRDEKLALQVFEVLRIRE